MIPPGKTWLKPLAFLLQRLVVHGVKVNQHSTQPCDRSSLVAQLHLV